MIAERLRWLLEHQSEARVTIQEKGDTSSAEYRTRIPWDTEHSDSRIEQEELERHVNFKLRSSSQGNAGHSGEFAGGAVWETNGHLTNILYRTVPIISDRLFQ